MKLSLDWGAELPDPHRCLYDNEVGARHMYAKGSAMSAHLLPQSPPTWIGSGIAAGIELLQSRSIQKPGCPRDWKLIYETIHQDRRMGVCNESGDIVSFDTAKQQTLPRYTCFETAMPHASRSCECILIVLC